jgi:drug/metabolite transporter (DMT)-like permease
MARGSKSWNVADRQRMRTETARLRLKSWICAAVVVSSNVSGNFFLKRGMPAELPSPLAYIAALFQPYVALGVLLLILWLVSRMTLLSWADLSYVLPVTAVGYALVALAGRVLLNERVSPVRWTGIVLIVGGVALVGFGTAPQTVPRSAAAAAPRARAAAGPGQ